MRFNFSQTFNTVTDESSASGDFESSGYEIEPCNNYGLRDIISELSRQGIEHLPILSAK